MTEAQFQAKLIKRIKARFPGCQVLKNDSSYQQGIPDLTVLFECRWATLEVKKSASAAKQPNQDHFIGELDKMSFAAVICPENEEAVFSALEQALIF